MSEEKANKIELLAERALEIMLVRGSVTYHDLQCSESDLAESMKLVEEDLGLSLATKRESIQ